MPVLQIVLDDDLYAKVTEAAEAKGHTRSSFGRYVLRQWVDADAVTVEQCSAGDIHFSPADELLDGGSMNPQEDTDAADQS
jgi:predicted transcriptional regulator